MMTTFHSDLRKIVDVSADIVSPEPPAIGLGELVSTSPQRARRDWWREGYKAGARRVSSELEKVLDEFADAAPTSRLYRCDRCGYETSVTATKHAPCMCSQTHCGGTRSQAPDAL